MSSKFETDERSGRGERFFTKAYRYNGKAVIIVTNKKRAAAVVSAAFVIVALIASLFFIVHEADHDCIGEGCPVCAVVALCQNSLETLGNSLIAVAAVFSCFFFTVLAVLFSLSATNLQTPISLKVKLLD